jgi:hypothetical protein
MTKEAPCSPGALVHTYIYIKLQKSHHLLVKTSNNAINHYYIVYKQPVYTTVEECSTRPIPRIWATSPFIRKMFPKVFVSQMKQLKCLHIMETVRIYHPVDHCDTQSDCFLR